MARKTFLPILIIALLSVPVRAAEEAPAASTSLTLLAGRSTIVDIGAAITRVSLTSSEVADALVTSSNQVLVHGKVPGTVSMFVWERGGGIHRYEVSVARDLARLDEQLKQLFPGDAIHAENNGNHIVLSGSVANKELIDRAVNLAAGYVEKRDEVVSVLRIQDAPRSNQVLLRVRFAEVSRSALTELGVSLFTSPTGVKNTLGRTTTQQFNAPGFNELKWSKASSDFGADVTSAKGKFTFSDFLNLFLFSEKYDLGAMIRALQSKGLFESLAEPNLVAESGKEASFLAGGEFPIPIAQGSASGTTITVQYKEFGVRLSFTPVVNGDRIHLKVRPEVSMLDFNNAVILSGFRIPALSTRRTETELELMNGQTFAIAGLMNNTMNSTIQKIPGIGDIPILGNLFKSKAARKDRTELVVIITPQILPNNSVGVTSDLPKLGEPFLSPLPDKQSFAPPRPAFQPGTGTSTESLPQSPEDRKAQARAKKQEAEKLADAGRAQAEQARRDADAARKQMEAQQKQDAERLAAAERTQAEKAKQDADAAKRQAEADKKAADRAAKEKAEAERKLAAESAKKQAAR